MFNRLFKGFQNIKNKIPHNMRPFKAQLNDAGRAVFNVVSSPVGISVLSAAAGSTVTWLHSQHGVIKDYEQAQDTIATHTKLIHELMQTNRNANATNHELRDELRKQLKSTVKTQFKMHEVKDELQHERVAKEELRTKLLACESERRIFQTALNFSTRPR